MSKQMSAIKKIIELCLVTSSIVFFCLPYVYGQSRDTPVSIKSGNLKPTYPNMSKRLNEQGSVILRVLVKSDGTVGSIEIKSSSDFPRIDQAAVDAVRNWQFNPATRNGSPIDEWYQIPISMYLKDEATVVTRVDPVYPPLSLQFGEQGVVILRFLVKNDGRVGTINVKTSSGFPRLDQAAEDALKKWRFNPATTGGKPIDEWYEVGIPFSNELADNKQNSKIISITPAELSEVVTDSGKDVPNSRNRSEKNDIDRERQQLAEERRRLEEEKRQREQAKSSQRINLQVTHTQPNADGSFLIEIQTNADTSSLKIDGKEEGVKPDGKYVIKRVARAGQASEFKIIATDIYGNTDTKTIAVNRKIDESEPPVTQPKDLAKVKVIEEYHKAFNRFVPYIVITSLQENLEIYKIEVNRGNCKLSENGELPARMKFGQSFGIVISWMENPCKIFEAKLYTNKGQSTVFLSPIFKAADTLQIKAGERWSRGLRRNVSYLDITSLQDEIVVTKVELNRGSCAPPQTDELPKKLKFGETLSLKPNWAGSPCNLIEVKISTSKGEFIHKVD